MVTFFLILSAICTFPIFIHCHFECIGTCYSGRLFPEPQDIFHGWHLKGFSYKNITTDNPRKCYSSCTQDCRCKACQMKDARCELLDEDKTSKNDSFVEESGYVYYDLKQTRYQGKSHMLPPGDCQNGCCRSQPCLNGGTCIEHCESPKEKFTCKCTNRYGGPVCETELTSCMDVLKTSRNSPPNGVYRTKVSTGAIVPVHCAFEQNPTRAWTLIESFAFSQADEFKYKAFYLDYEVDSDNPRSWNRYRMGLAEMKMIRSRSALFRATCDFPKRMNASLIPDLLIGRLSDVDILTYKASSCERYMYINIRGHNCSESTAFTSQDRDNRHFYIDVTLGKCEFRPPYIKRMVDSFGFYETTDSVSKCTATPQSTTQWWLGEEN